MKKIRAAVQGSLNFDFTAKAKTLPKVGQAVIGTGFVQGAGGKGSNQAVQLARLGAEVSMIGRVGRDFMGDFLLEKLAAEGIDLSFITRDDSVSTSMCSIYVDEEGRNQLIVMPFANTRCTAADVRAAEKKFAEADIILTQLETSIEAMEETVLFGTALGKPVVLNPAPAAKVSAEILDKVFIITPNETEAEEISGVLRSDWPAREWPAKAGAALRRMGAKRVIITLGSDGCYYTDGTTELRVPAFAVKAEDTTSAGDAFSGALCYALARGDTIEEAIRWGSAAGALAASRFGSQSSLGTLAEIEKFLEGA